MFILLKRAQKQEIMCLEAKENLYYCMKRDEAPLEHMLFRNKIFIILVERSNLVGY